MPTIAFLVIGGVWADRLPRNLLMTATNLLSAAAQLGMGAMLLSGHVVLWLALSLQFLTGTAMAFYLPSVQGLTAQIVPSEHLQRANALLSLTRSFAGSIGPLVASALVVTVGAGWALVADGVAFLMSAWLLHRIKLPRLPAGPAGSFVADLREGLREVTSRDWVWTSILAFMAGHLATAFFIVLGPASLLDRGEGAIGWGAVIAALSIGNVLGDVVAFRVVVRRPIVFCRLVELLGVPLLIAFALEAPAWVLIAAALPAGVAITLSDALWYTALQRHLPPTSLSRVTSYDWMGSFALRPLGYLAAGSLAASLGTAAAFFTAAALVVVVKLAGLLFAGVRQLPATSRPAVEEPRALAT